MIKLQLPVKGVSINQPFGANFVDFYQKLGMTGHNGIDFKAYNGCPIYATHNGVVTLCGKDGSGGIIVELTNDSEHFKTIYYHLKSYSVTKNQGVKAGEQIAIADNTGLYTTGDHLHYGMKMLKPDNLSTDDKNNGYAGAVDPSPYFVATYNGLEISNKDWDKSRCYHRYYRGRPKGGLINEAKTLTILAKKGIYPTAEKVNALVYGGWDLLAVQNPAMYEVWSQLKKDEFTNQGLKPFN
jgi:murein DD-endopeptidase MepM/ murein hydrolase activator NlpD